MFSRELCYSKDVTAMISCNFHLCTCKCVECHPFTLFVECKNIDTLVVQMLLYECEENNIFTLFHTSSKRLLMPPVIIFFITEK